MRLSISWLSHEPKDSVNFSSNRSASKRSRLSTRPSYRWSFRRRIASPNNSTFPRPSKCSKIWLTLSLRRTFCGAWIALRISHPDPTSTQSTSTWWRSRHWRCCAICRKKCANLPLRTEMWSNVFPSLAELWLTSHWTDCVFSGRRLKATIPSFSKYRFLNLKKKI